MPRLNNRGQAACGIGDGVASMDGLIYAGTLHPTKRTRHGGPEPVQKAGEVMWVDDDTIIYHTYAYESDGHAVLETCNVNTRRKVRVSDVGANQIIGNGGRWAAWLGTKDGYGTYDSANQFRALNTYPLDAGRDGTFAISMEYQADFPVWLFAPDGRVTECPDEPTLDISVIGPTSAIWVNTQTGSFRTLNARVPLQAAPGRGPKVCSLNNEDWVIYWANDIGLIAHPFEELEGYILETEGHAFNHDAVVVDGRILVAWSYTQGEAPWDLTKVTLDLTAPRVKFKTSFGTELPPGFRQFTSFSSGSTTGIARTRLVSPQLGLLEDDIVYRLSLLAVNVLQPLKDKYPNIVIKSGFRQVNSGISQHEMGEAVDIQINNQTPELLYEVAHYIANNLPFDQLVLNFSNIGDGQPWIHVSFSPKSLRGQVLTKDFADVFYEGLYLVEPLTGEAAAAALREQQSRDTLILQEMERMQKRQARLLPVSGVGDEAPAPAASSGGTGTGGGTGGGGTGSGNVTGRAALVQCVKSALNLPAGHSEEENIRNAFEVVKRVAWLLRDEGCGLLIGPSSGENVISWNGYTFRAGRVCFADGQIFKILSDVEGGTHAPYWGDDGIVDQSLYVPAMDPGTDINMNWMQCALPAEPAPEPPAPPHVPGGPTGRPEEESGPGGRES